MRGNFFQALHTLDTPGFARRIPRTDLGILTSKIGIEIAMTRPGTIATTLWIDHLYTIDRPQIIGHPHAPVIELPIAQVARTPHRFIPCDEAIVDFLTVPPGLIVRSARPGHCLIECLQRPHLLSIGISFGGDRRQLPQKTPVHQTDPQHHRDHHHFGLEETGELHPSQFDNAELFGIAAEILPRERHKPDLHPAVAGKKNRRLMHIGDLNILADEPVEPGRDKRHQRRIDKGQEEEENQQPRTHQHRKERLGHKDRVRGKNEKQSHTDP